MTRDPCAPTLRPSPYTLPRAPVPSRWEGRLDVGVGIYVLNIANIDTARGTFEAEFFLFFQTRSSTTCECGAARLVARHQTRAS